MLDDSFLEAEQTSSHYQVLARRTRPQSFAELVGQEVVAKTLETMLTSGRIPHAFLFTGTRGTGKTSSARILAKSLCCEKGPTISPCQVCVHCKQITACAHEDVLEIDGASNTGVDQIRELRESARFYPNSARYRVFVIDEVHMLSIGAFNALLKILEEPPPQVFFILATTELHKVPITVRSRCTILPFRKVDAEQISKHLSKLLQNENISFDVEALTLISRAAKGSLRDSLSLTEQVIALSGGEGINEVSTREALGLMGSDLPQTLFKSILEKDAGVVLQKIKEADTASVDLGILLEETASFFRFALIAREVKDDDKTLRLTNLLPKELEQVRTNSSEVSTAALSEIFRALVEGAREVGRSKDPLSWAEMTLLDCIARSDWLSSGEVLALLGGAPAPLNPNPQSSGTPSTIRQTQNTVATKSTAVTSVQTAQNNSNNPGPSQTTRNADSSNLDGFAKVIQRIQEKSVTLAAKLKNADIVSCTTQQIVFADTASNKLYTQLNLNDAKTFLAALKETEYANAVLKGIEFPKDSHKNVTSDRAGAARAPGTSVQKNTSQQKSAFDAFDDLPVVAQKTPPGTNTVHSLEQQKKLAELKEKEKRILNMESMRKLSEMATSVEIRPLDETK